MLRFKSIVIALLLCLAIPTSAHPHGGRLDSFGCHHNRKQGGYHCHEGKNAGRTFTSKAEMLSETGGRSEQSVKSFSGKVVGVTDGDTIKVMRSGKEVKVRLAGIDCPEKKQAFGRKAKQFTSTFVFGEVVTVKIKDIDRFGRTVGEVILSDGRSLNRELVRTGLAWWYRKYSKDKSLGALEQRAREKKIGLWQDKNPIAPWEFRKGKREKR